MRYRGENRITGPASAQTVPHFLRASAWANWDGTATAVLNDSFNVTSLTDNGTGDVTITFIPTMFDANYALAQSTIGIGAYIAGAAIVNNTGGATTTSVRLLTIQTDVGTVDSGNFNGLVLVGKR